MRIATWNVNGLRARMEFITHWLKSRAPDVVGLQEVKVSDEDFPHADFRALGYHAVVHGENGWNGVAVLSRTPAEAETRGLPDRENDGARLLRVHVSGLHFATVYCPNGKTLNHPDFPRKLAWLDALRDYLVGPRPGCRVRHWRGFQYRPGGTGLLAGRRSRRFDLLHHRGAVPVPVPPGSEAHGLVSPRAPGGAEVLLVGLPAWFLPSRSRAAHRSAAGYARRGLAGAPRGDRSRVSQEEGRSHCV